MPVASKVVYAGIDIAKKKLDAFTPEGGHKCFANEQTGLQSLTQWLKGHGVTHIVIEPTGGFERALKQAAQSASLHVLEPNASWVRHHAQAAGRLAKTDKIDARMLHDYALTYGDKLRVKEPDSKAQAQLRALGRRRQQLIDTLRKERNRLAQVSDAYVREDLNLHIEYLKNRLDALDDKSEQSAEADPQLKVKKAAMMQVKCVGPVLAKTLLAFMPELGTLSRRQVAKMVGVAPTDHQSGEHDGPCPMTGGRIEVRNCLYMACLSATHWHAKIAKRYQHLLCRGKPAKVAIGACMRHLLIEINAEVRKALTDPALTHQQIASET